MPALFANVIILVKANFNNKVLMTQQSRTLSFRFILFIIITVFFLLWLNQGKMNRLQISAAKAFTINDKMLSNYVVSEVMLTEIAGILHTTTTSALPLNNPNLELISAVRLGYGEAQAWRDLGCEQSNCAHISFYDYENGGTHETILDLDTNSVVDEWQDLEAQPVPTQRIGKVALEIAGNSPDVIATLGDINSADIAMVPMNAWLEDGDCIQDWCVDLTFHAPDNSGRIYHVLVNMRQQAVADTFYSRARTTQAIAQQPDTDPLFEDGCHEAFDWQICWEMTAHDATNFYNATFQGKNIFSSAKIGQVEVYYGSWPGGYRDELGFESSVPPKGGTEIREFEDGFEVSQLFTEPFQWPSCVCCYRYTQKMTFFADGSFEPGFISHGPGCDDPSVYRPFWRIDPFLDDATGDEIYVWENNDWQEAITEREFSLYEDTAPTGEKMAIMDGDLSFRWYPLHTDPLGVDEAKIFLIRNKNNEGNFAIGAGDANTFQPPAQYVDGEAVSGEDNVIWYIPLMKTKRGGPWWCMPEPAPDYSPCSASVLIKTAGKLADPAPLDLSQQTTVPPTDSAPQLTPTPAKIAGISAEMVWINSGCGACHALASLGSDGAIGPDLSEIGLVSRTRIPNMSGPNYILQAIVDPNNHIVADCPNGACQANVMPNNYARRLNTSQMDLLINFLLAQRGDATLPTITPAVTNTPETIGATETNPTPVVAIGATAVNGNSIATSTPAPSSVPISNQALPLAIGLSFGLLFLIAGILFVRRSS
jgi:hypothetical protein